MKEEVYIYKLVSLLVHIFCLQEFDFNLYVADAVWVSSI